MEFFDQNKSQLTFKRDFEWYQTARVIEVGAVQVPWNSKDFQETARLSEIGALQVPWNSMKPLVSSKLAHS